MRDYTYKGWEPYGTGECYIIDHYCDSDLFDNDCKPTEESIKNGMCTFEVVNNNCAYLKPKRGGVIEIHFVPCNKEM